MSTDPKDDGGFGWWVLILLLGCCVWASIVTNGG